MIYWTEYKPIEWQLIKTNKKTLVCNDIFTLDTEVSSGFKWKNKIIPYSHDMHDLLIETKKVAWLYIWQVGINNTIYYGRTLEELKSFMELLAKDCPYKKYFYIHNLAYDCQSLFNIVDMNNIECFARKPREPMKLYVSEWDIEFRCSLMLTNLKLEKCAEYYQTEHKKLVGNLDYNKLISPKDKMEQAELDYAENDLLVMYEFLEKFRLKYGSVHNIPLTQTGELRRELYKIYRNNLRYIRKVQDMYAGNVAEWNAQQQAFMGGYTHGNSLYVNRIITKSKSKDISSSYPRSLLKKMPMGRFIRTRKRTFNFEKECYIIRTKLYNIKSKYYNNIIAFSKCLDDYNVQLDNGRIASADMVEIQVTDIDYRLIKDWYEIEKEEIQEVYVCHKKDYLDKDMIQFILDNYAGKTTLKGIDEKYEIYMKMKQYINSLYGCNVTMICGPEIELNENIEDLWKAGEVTEEYILQKLKKQKKSYKCLNNFAWGVWCSAYSRESLLRTAMQLDEDVLYMDTDSIKYIGDHEDIFNNYNDANISDLKEVCESIGVDFSLCVPADIKGNIHPLGNYEDDGEYEKFITLGAKKYCYETDDGLHITVSGVSKKAANQLEKIEDFKEGLLFDSRHCGKQLLTYLDKQEPFTLPDGTIINQKYAIHMMPTTYKLSLTKTFADYIEAIQQRGYYIPIDEAYNPFFDE